MSSPTIEELVEGVLGGDRTRLAQALTLIESRRVEDQSRARRLLDELEGQRAAEVTSHRIGISGLPGAGKSTLIEGLGSWLIETRGRRVAVLAVDPTSPETRGSILGDKTRMGKLAQHSNAFVRPSPSGGALGGVAGRTQEAIRLLEAANYDVVFVETVGVGQTEAAVSAMVDTFVVLLVPGTGDELQGIKRGILELVHLLVINKADGESASLAESARRDYALALHLLRAEADGWRPRVSKVSALEGHGLEELWQSICEHREQLTNSGRLVSRRAGQRVDWMWRLVEEGIVERTRALLRQGEGQGTLEADVRSGLRSPAEAAAEILQRLVTR